jgi:hypothetical protein
MKRRWHKLFLPVVPNRGNSMRGRPFQAGQSGNPGGRPKVLQEVRELARSHCPAAIEELARLALNSKSERLRLAAICELFDRGYGKAVPAIEGEVGAPIVIQLTENEARG